MSAKARVAKVVKITDIYTLERLQTKYPGCELDVVHLVRDPRGSINSRMVRNPSYDHYISIEYFTLIHCTIFWPFISKVFDCKSSNGMTTSFKAKTIKFTKEATELNNLPAHPFSKDS